MHNIGQLGLIRNGGAFDFASLYAGGKKGIWYQPLDANTRYQDQAGTMPATIANPATGLLLDKSGNALPLRQATSTARPLFDARVNLLTKTEQFDDAVWTKNNSTITSNTAIAPDGALVADTLTNNAVSGEHRVYQGVSQLGARSCFAKAGSASFLSIAPEGTSTVYAEFNLLTGVVVSAAGCTGEITPATNGFYRCSISSAAGPNGNLVMNMGEVAGQAIPGVGYVGTGKTIYLWGAQIETGPIATRYQRVNTDNDYDIADFPQSLKYNGIGAGMGTNSFVAGTLTSNMDYFIAFKRNSSSKFLSAASGVAPNEQLFGIVEVGNGASATSQSGTPTYFVNGVSVAGGTATTRDQLNSAMPVGQWVILEVRNLDLSVWTAVQLSQYANYLFNANQGSVVCCEAQPNTVRTQIRQALAAEVGITL